MKDVIEQKNEVLENGNKNLRNLLEDYCKLNNLEYDINKKYFNDEIQNNLNWYGFKKNSSILEIGSDFGDLTLMLLQKDFFRVHSLTFGEISRKIIYERINSSLVLNKNIEYKCYIQEELLKTSLNENERYDYITIIGLDKLIDKINFQKEMSVEEKVIKILSFAKSLLKEKGKIFITFDNYIGIKNFSYVSSNGLTEIEAGELLRKNIFTKTGILDIIRRLNLNINSILYPFPSYTFPEVILSDNSEDVIANIKKYSNVYPQKSYITLNENLAMYNILKSSNKFMETFANSIFLELNSESFCEKDSIKLISFNNERKEKYKLITIIKNDMVEKIPSSNLALDHLNNIKENLNNLKEYEIETLDYIEDGRVCSKFVKNRDTLDRIIFNNRNNINYVIDIFNNIKNILLKQKEDYDEVKAKKIIEIVGEENKELLSELNYVNHGFWDMVPKNCFLIENKFYFFDQEWMENYIPIEFIIYRGIINCYDYVRVTNLEEIYKSLNLSRYIEIFEKLDNYFREEIFDKEKLNQNIAGGQKKISDLILENNDIINLKEYVNALENKIKMFENENFKKEQYILDLQNQNKNLQKKLNNTIKYKLKRIFKSKGEKL